MYKKSLIPLFLSGLTACLSIPGLSGCASTPPPTEEVALAESAINQAESSEAQKHAPRELHSAKQKLDAAQTAMLEGDHDHARRMAEQAEIDARLAERKAQSVRTQQSIDKVQTGIREIRGELDK